MREREREEDKEEEREEGEEEKIKGEGGRKQGRKTTNLSSLCNFSSISGLVAVEWVNLY